jgi:hypothetical protein
MVQSPGIGNPNRTNDTFAEIAAGGMNLAGKGLVELNLPVLGEKGFELTEVDEAAVFTPLIKMSTAEELQDELERKRQEYAPFMEQHAPTLPSYRIRQEIKEFDWRMGTVEDEQDFIGTLQGRGIWKRVTIPHYGEPLGKAFTLYRTTFGVSEDMLNIGRVYICFKGVDYKAHVFVNGHYLGSHEGFFGPFEFDCTNGVRSGSNTLLVKVENDFICGDSHSGDKIYAATGLGYDDPERGWHHCPPGMGIYQSVAIEARPAIHIGSVFVRPLADLEQAEAWVEVQNIQTHAEEIKLRISIYGRNFTETVIEQQEYMPFTSIEVGMGDSFTEANLQAQGKLNTAIPLKAEYGRNRFVLAFRIPQSRIWELESPWLYQIHVELVVDDHVLDTWSSHFGMRTFELDTANSPKGAMYFNGRQIRLRGANTMGHEQQCVMKEDWNQLRDDLLLAKICNMNFLRITQRPVQSEVYDYCDMIGLMTQTDLPLFGVLSRSQFCEAVRQSEEMERLIRCHPCNIIVSYINEPFPNAKNKPQRHLTRPELMAFFKAADIVVKLNNPDRITKHIDGDYDPPSEGLPDNHCYPCWYNGHGIDIGRLNRGYWLPVKPDWYYGCGEYGAEGLDPVALMRKYYPESWMPLGEAEETMWSPNAIIGAQSGRFHYFFYETPDTLIDWVEESHKHQAWATRIMTEAFRRDELMTTFAIHLFIDAFPSGWMKTIIDVERQPKPAYFAYRDALEPLMVSLRTDRLSYFAGEAIRMEAWICNDRAYSPEGVYVHCMVLLDGKPWAAARQEAHIPLCSSSYHGEVRFNIPDIEDRTTVTVILALVVANGSVLHNTTMSIEVFPKKVISSAPIAAAIIGSANGKAARLAEELSLTVVELSGMVETGVVLVDDVSQLVKWESKLFSMVEAGTRIVVLELDPGDYLLLGEQVRVKSSSMMPLHFASRKTGHRTVEGFRPDDFRLWYSPDEDYIKALLNNTFCAEGMTPILLSGNTNDLGEWGPALAVGEKLIGEGALILCQVALAGRCGTNPVAEAFAMRLLQPN